MQSLQTCYAQLNLIRPIWEKNRGMDTFLSDAAWAIFSTYHTVLKASPGAAIFGQDMLFDTLFMAAWKKLGQHRQRQLILSPLEKMKAD
jgi:hypothetical protein